MPLAVVSAADIDLTGGVGERAYRPTTVAELRPEYRLGVGQMDVDLRRWTLPPADGGQRAGRHGRGARARPRRRLRDDRRAVGVGAVDLPDRVGEGPDLDIDLPHAATPGQPSCCVTADVGVGHLQIDHFGSGCA